MASLFIVEIPDCEKEAFPTKREAVAYASGFAVATVIRKNVTASRRGASLYCALYNHKQWAGLEREIVFTKGGA